jgi:uncharacterized heparinase superfamily protein
MAGEATFEFLNQIKAVEFPFAWEDCGASRLWCYNLHYFEDLNANKAEERSRWHENLVSTWIRQNPPCRGTGWEPYPTSMRTVNWIKWALSENQQDEATLHSLSLHCHWLDKRVEHHLLGNHLWLNGKALIFGGLFFVDTEADKWLSKGLNILEHELNEQILEDGGHFERSPMYHSLILEDVLDILQMDRLYPGNISPRILASLKEVLPKMFNWLRCMSHPDGEVTFFNDSVSGIAPSYVNLLEYAQSLDFKNLELPKLTLNMLDRTGYVRADLAQASLICDVAELGPDYQPGHGHADTLSFELSLFGQRFIVNSGINHYEADDDRLLQRGTAAHNTVEVDNKDSSEVWSSFRVARRARPFDFEIQNDGEFVSICCKHDGYRRLPGKVIHERRWDFSGSSLKVQDLLAGSFSKAVARFHLHPLIEINQLSLNHCDLCFDGHAVSFTSDGAELRVVSKDYYPSFGLNQETNCIELTFTEKHCIAEISW